MTTTQPYLRRINGVIDHIRAHPDGDLSLAALAAVAGFSPFHFHRIFSGIVGETVHDFVQRVRLDRAAALMKGSPSRATLLGMSQDDPEVTPLELCHYDLCLTAPADWQGDGAVAVRDFLSWRLAALHCEGDIFNPLDVRAVQATLKERGIALILVTVASVRPWPYDAPVGDVPRGGRPPCRGCTRASG